MRDTSIQKQSDMSDLDPEHFTLRQAAQARDDFAQVMDEPDFVKELIARIPTRRDQAFVPLKIMLGSVQLSLCSSARVSASVGITSRTASVDGPWLR